MERGGSSGTSGHLKSHFYFILQKIQGYELLSHLYHLFHLFQEEINKNSKEERCLRADVRRR